MSIVYFCMADVACSFTTDMILVRTPKRFDELHPSEQSDRIVARQIANTLQGLGNNYTTWFS